MNPRGAHLPIAACCGIVVFSLAACSGNVSKKTAGQLNDIRSVQAQHTATITELKDEIRSLRGKVEEMEYVSRGKTQELTAALQRFGSRVPPPEGVPAELLAQDEERIARNTGAAADAFRQGLQQIRQGDFERGRLTFENFLLQNPDTTFSDNALFWIGICFDKMAQYDRAIVSYSEVFQRYPAEDRVPAALFQLAESFVKIESKNDAVMTLSKLVDEHPSSPYARKARSRIKELKKKKRRR